MDGENNGKPYEQMDDFGGNLPLFLVQHPYSSSSTDPTVSPPIPPARPGCISGHNMLRFDVPVGSTYEHGEVSEQPPFFFFVTAQKKNVIESYIPSLKLTAVLLHLKNCGWLEDDEVYFLGIFIYFQGVYMLVLGSVSYHL